QVGVAAVMIVPRFSSGFRVGRRERRYVRSRFIHSGAWNKRAGERPFSFTGTAMSGTKSNGRGSIESRSKYISFPRGEGTIMRTVTGSLCVVLWLAAPSSAEALTGLIRDLSAKDPDVRRAAATELGRLGAEAKPAVAALVSALKDQDVFVRRFSAQALGEIGPEASGAVSALSSALRDKDRRVVE